MTSCFHCGNSEKSELLETIYKTGVVNICKTCYPKFKLPIVEKKMVDWTEVEKRKSVRDRLSDMAHVKVVKGINNTVKKKNPEDMTLRDIVEKNFEKQKIVASEVPTDLVDNYNWAIMRRRRAIKLTIKELSEKIREPELIVSSLEKGVLPRDYTSLIRKVEAILSVRLFKELKKEFHSDDIIAESQAPTGILVEEIKEKTSFFNWFKKKKDVSIEEVNAVLESEGEEHISNKQKVWERAVANVRSDIGSQKSEVRVEVPVEEVESGAEDFVYEAPREEVVARTPVQRRRAPSVMEGMRASRERLRNKKPAVEEVVEIKRPEVKEKVVSEEDVYKDLMKAKDEDLSVDNFSLDSVNDLIGEPVKSDLGSQMTDALEEEEDTSFESRMDGGFSAVDDSFDGSVVNQVGVEAEEEPEPAAINEFNSPHSYMGEDVPEERQSTIDDNELNGKEEKKEDLNDEDITDLIWGRK